MHAVSRRVRVVPRPLKELDPESAKLIENVTVDSKGRLVPKLYSKTWANAELRKMLNIGGQKDREQTDVSRLSDAELIQRLADQAKELGIEIDLNYTFAQPKKMQFADSQKPLVGFSAQANVGRLTHHGANPEISS